MQALFFFEKVFGAFAFVFIIWQVIVPLWMNRPLFPIFRRQTKLRKELIGAEEEVLEARLEQEVKKVHQEADNIRSNSQK